MKIAPHEILKRARIARGFRTATDAARAFDWNPVTYMAHENGTRGLRKDSARRYAQAFGIKPGDLLELKDSSEPLEAIEVVGDAAWGVWRDMALEESAERQRVFLPVSRKGKEPRAAVRVTDESCNRSIQRGWFAIYRPIEAAAEIRQLQPGTLVVLRRMRSDKLEELSVRCVVARNANSLSVSGFSTDRKFSTSLAIPFPNDGQKSMIAGVVVGHYAEY